MGDGGREGFWTSYWLNGAMPKSVAPLIPSASKRKNICVRDALAGHQWVADIYVGAFTVEHIAQFLTLWELLEHVALTANVPDKIACNLTENEVYTAGSAYKAQFAGAIRCSFSPIVWKPWAPPKCRFFAWLVVQNWLWTSDRLAMRGWPHQPVCQLCKCQPETARHTLFECRFSKRIWQAAAAWLSCPSLLICVGAAHGKMLQYWEKAWGTHCILDGVKNHHHADHMGDMEGTE